ncbi:hypothetical protein PV325_011603 [Microctonus aethiopoides]|uniref:Uncharacterized protein n=1 Tax=Microctonus aethiopoides TaxID=144406 RepID=A0AA39F8S9_9HYME|nr:hypothetical protein PV325_011603 [Microctonus aethiopoides]KAK0095701.1 hypothetical protein PV326_007628 [Microctonus aethiopoides]KAK0164941.1 hypothetical protein PV328_003505 [Microctonus aethiopoides]
MKSIAVIFTLCIVGALSALNEEQRNKIKEHRDKCIEETKVDIELVNKAHRGEWMVDDEKLRCFASCLLKKLDMISDDGSLKEDVTLAKMTLDVGADKAKEILDKCKEITASDVCEKGLKLMKCYTDNKATIVVA